VVGRSSVSLIAVLSLTLATGKRVEKRHAWLSLEEQATPSAVAMSLGADIAAALRFDLDCACDSGASAASSGFVLSLA
jgi:hypothetical protein